MADHLEQTDNSSDSDDDRSSTTSFGFEPVENNAVAIPPTFTDLSRLLCLFNMISMWIMFFTEYTMRLVIRLVLMLRNAFGTAAEPFHSTVASDHAPDQNQVKGDRRADAPVVPISSITERNADGDGNHGYDVTSTRIYRSKIDPPTAISIDRAGYHYNDPSEDNICENVGMNEEDDCDEEFESLQVNDNNRNYLDDLIIHESQAEEADDMNNYLIDENEHQFIIDQALLDDPSDTDSGLGSSVSDSDSDTTSNEDATESNYDADSDTETTSDDNESESSDEPNNLAANEVESDQDEATADIVEQVPQIQHEIPVNDTSSDEADDPPPDLAPPYDGNANRMRVVYERKDNHPVIHETPEEYSD